MAATNMEVLVQMTMTGIGIVIETRITMKKKKIEKYYPAKSSHGFSSFKKGTNSVSQNKDSVSSRVSKSCTKVTKNDKYSSGHSQSSSAAVNDDDDFDYDPRGTSTAKASAGSSKQVDLFGQDLIGDLMDAPTSVPTEKPPTSSMSEVDLFADAAFVSAEPHADQGASSQSKDLDPVTATIEYCCRTAG